LPQKRRRPSSASHAPKAAADYVRLTTITVFTFVDTFSVNSVELPIASHFLAIPVQPAALANETPV
jgi:hypothetical protein